MKKLVGLAALLVCLCGSNAKADLIYTFDITGETTGSNVQNAAVGYQFGLVLADSAKGSGVYYSIDTQTLQVYPNPVQTIADPANPFLSIPASDMTGNGLYNPMTVSAVGYTDDAAGFSVDNLGNITGGEISIQDTDADLIISLSNGTFSGSYVADGGPCFFDPGCQISGTYTLVPEPSSFAVLLASVFGVGWIAAKRRPA